MSKFTLKFRWSIWTGIGWSVCTEIDGQFRLESGGQFDRFFQIKSETYFKCKEGIIQMYDGINKDEAE